MRTIGTEGGRLIASFLAASAVAVALPRLAMADRVISKDYTLTADTDWRSYGILTLDGATIHLAGYSLKVYSIKGIGAVTSSVTEFSDLTGNGAVASSGGFSAKYPASNLFDNNIGTVASRGTTSDAPLVVVYDFGGAKHVNRYRIYAATPVASAKAGYPRDWTFDGSDNNSDWMVLDARSDQLLSNGKWHDYDFDNPDAYRYYRLKVTRGSRWSPDTSKDPRLDIGGELEFGWVSENKLSIDASGKGDSDLSEISMDDGVKVVIDSPTAAKVSIPVLIPMPREMKLTGGECRVVGEPKVETAESIPSEGYELSIARDGVIIRHSDAAGLFYARMTLEQLRSPETAALPCLEIKDSPVFKWRGVHVAETQKIFGKDAIKSVIDLMSRYKFNVFHWHFTDNRGWRIDFPEYPNLARRSDLPGLCENEQPAFYSEGDARDIIAYAKERHITIVPELDFPGHCGAVANAYPDFACRVARGKTPEELCVGNPETLKFVERALDWVCELFPSETVHIGGDECQRSAWAKCPRCLEFMKREGLNDTKEIQPWVTRYLAACLAKKGRKAVGWDDVAIERSNTGNALDAHLLPNRENVMVMGYRCRDVIYASIAANMGYKVVQSPFRHCYFDFSQGFVCDPFRYFGHHRTTLELAYKFDPYKDVTPEARSNVIGGQCCNWTLYTFNRYDLEWKMWPRALATAEILWSYPDPAKRDFAEFSARAAEHRRRLIHEHINCALVVDVDANQAKDAKR